MQSATEGVWQGLQDNARALQGSLDPGCVPDTYKPWAPSCPRALLREVLDGALPGAGALGSQGFREALRGGVPRDGRS